MTLIGITSFSTTAVVFTITIITAKQPQQWRRLEYLLNALPYRVHLSVRIIIISSSHILLLQFRTGSRYQTTQSASVFYPTICPLNVSDSTIANASQRLLLTLSFLKIYFLSILGFRPAPAIYHTYGAHNIYVAYLMFTLRVETFHILARNMFYSLWILIYYGVFHVSLLYVVKTKKTR